MLLIETNSISNMGCQKFKNVRSLRYSGYLTNTSCVCQVAIISKRSNNKQNSFVPKKIWDMLLFETDKNLISWIVTRVPTRDYTVCGVSWRQIGACDHETNSLHCVVFGFLQLPSLGFQLCWSCKTNAGTTFAFDHFFSSWQTILWDLFQSVSNLQSFYKKTAVFL